MAKDLIGQQLGNYRVVSLLGRGGFAEVYLGQHVDIPTLQAAIKVLHLTEVNTQKFRQEAAIIASLKHPHIIRLSDFSDRQDMPFLVMDYAPNGSLRKRHSPEDKVPLATIVQYTTQIADALQYAHEMHVIHRDIKPDNVLIGSRGELLLSDFGIAVISETGRTTLNSPYGTAGTPYYMAPEMFRGKPDKASDQYALAVMVYQWLSGTLPFDQGDFIQLGYQHAHEPVPPLRERVPFVSEDVETVVMTALAKDPKERFTTVQAFATALELAGQPKQPVYGLMPSNTKPSKPELPLPSIAPAPRVVQVVTQPETDTPGEQPQPFMPAEPEQSQVQATPQSPMPKQSPSSGSIAQHKPKSMIWKATVVAAMVATAIAGGGASLLNVGLVVPILIAAVVASVAGRSVIRSGLTRGLLSGLLASGLLSGLLLLLARGFLVGLILVLVVLGGFLVSGVIEVLVAGLAGLIALLEGKFSVIGLVAGLVAGLVVGGLFKNKQK